MIIFKKKCSQKIGTEVCVKLATKVYIILGYTYVLLEILWKWHLVKWREFFSLVAGTTIHCSACIVQSCFSAIATVTARQQPVVFYPVIRSYVSCTYYVANINHGISKHTVCCVWEIHQSTGQFISTDQLHHVLNAEMRNNLSTPYNLGYFEGRYHAKNDSQKIKIWKLLCINDKFSTGDINFVCGAIPYKVKTMWAMIGHHLRRNSVKEMKRKKRLMYLKDKHKVK